MAGALHRSAAALAVVMLAACSPPPALVVHDLAAAAPFAEIESPWVVVRPGSLDAEMLEERGFERAPIVGDDPSTVLRSPATLLVPLGAKAGGRLLVDIAPEQGYEGRELEVAVGGAIVARQRMAIGRQRIAATLPADLKAEGRTRIRFRVGGEAARSRRGPFVAQLYGLTAGPSGGPFLDAAGGGRARAVVSTEGTGDRAAIVQASASRLRFALMLPRDPVLAFAVESADGGGGCGAPRVALAVGTPGEAPRTAWAGTADPPGAGRRLEADLGVPSGGPAWVVLSAEARAGCTAWVRWIAPRVSGRAAVPAPAAAEGPETPALAAARRALSGTSVVLVVLDAARAGNLGCYGHPGSVTPEIDRLAADGIVFESHYTPAVFTYAAMAAIWTSRPPDEGGGEWLAEGVLPRGLVTLTEVLAARGVPAEAFVANPSAGPAFGLDRGFTRSLRLYREPWTTGPAASGEVFDRPVGDALSKSPAPFFAYLHVREPHMPYGAPLAGPDAPLGPEAKHQEFWDRVNRGERAPTAAEWDHLARLYDGNLHAADRAVGALRAQLEALGLWDRTTLMVTADHGEALGEHGHVGHNQQVYEESIHVPLVVRFPPGVGPRGARIPALTRHLDLAPTVADIFGIAGGAVAAFRGRSLLPLLFAAAPPAVAVARTTGTRPVYAVRAGAHKYLFDRTAAREELYDLGSDPGERRDLAPASPLLVAVFRQMLSRRLAEVRRGARLEPAPAALDARDTESLRALGYVR